MGLLVGISGRAEHGKSSTADAVVAYAASKGLYATSFELSNYILQYAIQRNLLPNKTRKQLNKEEVQVLVEVGESVRASDPKMWINRAMKEIEDYKPDVGIVPNVRRTYEADVIKEAGGVIIKVVAINKNGSEFISQTRDPNNELESGANLIQADYFITTRRGESQLLKAYARTLFDHVYALQPKIVDTRQIEMFEAVAI